MTLVFFSIIDNLDLIRINKNVIRIIEDVKVYLKEPDGKEHKVTTDENGIAKFEDLIPGIYNIRIEEK